MFDARVAIDIESCDWCAHLIFPGEDVLLTGSELIHAEHEANTSPLLSPAA